MTINERFTVIINTLYSGNKSAFAKAIGVAPSVVDNIVGKRQGKPSYDVIEKVSALAAINLNWLISEIGEPLDFYNRKKEQPEEKKAASPELELRLLEMISDKDKTIREQAEELGRLRERIAQLEQRLEKNCWRCQHRRYCKCRLGGYVPAFTLVPPHTPSKGSK